MKATTTTELRANLAARMDEVNDDHEPLLITRANGRPAVLVSLEDYNSIEETAYLLRSPANAKRLMESISELERGEAQERDLVECD